MHCKVAPIFLLCITATNAMVISHLNFLIHPSEAIEQPSRHLLPPFEDQFGSQLHSNGIFRSAQSVWQLFDEAPARYEEFAPQPYPYEVVNRVLPHVEESTDFQPLEQQVTKAAEDVKSVQKNVNDFENYLQGVAATLAPQNKPENRVVIIITTKKTPMREDGSTGRLENLLSSLFSDESTDSDRTEEEKAHEKRFSSMLEQDHVESYRGARQKELENVVDSMLGRKESTDNDSADEEKEFEKFISNAFEEEDYTESDNARDFSEKAVGDDDDVDEAAQLNQFISRLYSSKPFTFR